MKLPIDKLNWLRVSSGPDANYAVERIEVRPKPSGTQIIFGMRGHQAICCLLCGMASFNTSDIEHRYCACCKNYFAALPSWSEAGTGLARASQALPGQIAQKETLMFWIKSHRKKHLNLAQASSLLVQETDPDEFPKNRYGIEATFNYTRELIGAWETEEEAERHLDDLMEAMGRAFPHHIPRGKHEK